MTRYGKALVRAFQPQNEAQARALGRIIGAAIVVGVLLLVHACQPVIERNLSAPPGPPPTGVHSIAPPNVKVAAEAGPYEMWVMPPGPLCIQEKGLAYWHVGTASDYYDTAPEIDIVHPDTGCVGFPRRRMIVVTTFVDHTVAACAKASGVKYSWLYAYGRWTWVSEEATIWINAAPEAKTRCFSHSTGVAHVASHELGHILGLAHNTDASVMGAWSYYWPTALDKSRVRTRYTVPS